MTWNDHFLELFDRCLNLYRGGNNDFNTYYNADELNFLSSIGYKPREFFDFIEDFGDSSDPTPTTALLVAAVRRDYLTVAQDGKLSDFEIQKGDLPTFGDQLDGIFYLPRILKKAEHKLRGELDPDIMYGCGGDRKFLREHNIHPADFLRNVWAADGDTQKIVDYVKSQSSNV